MKKKILALLLCGCVILSMIPSAAAYATGTEENNIVTKINESTNNAVSADNVNVGDKVWIRTGTKIYKSIDDTEGYSLALSYAIKIEHIISDENGNPIWYKFTFADLSAILGNLFLKDYSYIKVTDTAVSEDEANTPNGSGEESQECNCGENAPENIAEHADSCPRKQYVKSLITNEAGGYKTAAEVYDDWDEYDENTQKDILNMIKVYAPTSYEELVEFTSPKEPKKEQQVEGKTFKTDKSVIVQSTKNKKMQAIENFVTLDTDDQKAYLFDIHGEDGKNTNISVSGLISDNDHKHATVLHLLDNADAIKKAMTTGMGYGTFSVTDTTEFTKEVVAAKEATGNENCVFYVILDAEIAKDGTITFQTDNFSTFIYVVTFEYEGYIYDITGGTTVYLSELMRNLDLDKNVSDVTDVSFSNPNLLSVEKNQNDWILTPLESFSSQEFLKLTFSDESNLTIKVTDPVMKYYLTGKDSWCAETESISIKKSGASSNYKENVKVNKEIITSEELYNAADKQNDTIDMVIYARPGMAIRVASGTTWPDGWFEADGTYNHGDWEWIWDGTYNYALLSDNVKISKYVDIDIKVKGTEDDKTTTKTCKIRIHIIPTTDENSIFTLVRDTVERDEQYSVKTIPVTLYDYDGYKWNHYWNEQNNGYWYAFYNSSQGQAAQTGVNVPWTGGHLPNSGNISQGVFASHLDSNNLPVFSSDEQTDLFSKKTNDSMGKTVYSDVGFEFIYENNSGYYTYSSNLNHAQYNSENNTIELYDQSLGALLGSVQNSAAGFYPFADIHESFPNSGSSNVAWKDALTDSYKTNYAQYSMQTVSTGDAKSEMNMHYGIQIEADFYMPMDKKSQVDKKDLVYEFTGDDDLWVFVDDQLVLDLGGAHTPISGSVNFTQGTVTVGQYYPVTANGNTYTEAEGASSSNAKTFTFKELGIEVKEDQMHTLRVFYLERWSGESNCRMRFNLPLAPENSVLVSKELTNQDGEELSVTPNVDYTFALYYAEDDDDNVDQPENAFNPWANKTYTIQGTNQQGTTDEDGKFTLKAGQTALFEGVPRFAEVYAIEYENNDGYIYTEHLVSVGGSNATKYELGKNTEKKVIQRTGSLSFKFTNRMQTQPLTFEKKVVNGIDGLIDKDQKFTFDLKFTKNILETDKNAIKANDGKTLTNGEPFELGHNEFITIPRVPVNMTFDFGEQNPDSTNNSFDNPKYEFTNVTCSVTPDNFNKYSWTVGLEGINKIIVTNQQRFDLIIKKIGISDTDNNKEESQSTIYNVVGMAGNEEIYKGQVAIVGNDSITIKDLPVGTYTVTEDVNWSWRYELKDITVENNANAQVDRSNKKATFKPISTEELVTFTNERDNANWLSGDTHCRNWWGKDGKVEKTSSASKNN